jgi:hypothetical protein
VSRPSPTPRQLLAESSGGTVLRRGSSDPGPAQQPVRDNAVWVRQLFAPGSSGRSSGCRLHQSARSSQLAQMRHWRFLLRSRRISKQDSHIRSGPMPWSASRPKKWPRRCRSVAGRMPQGPRWSLISRPNGPACNLRGRRRPIKLSRRATFPTKSADAAHTTDKNLPWSTLPWVHACGR